MNDDIGDEEYDLNGDYGEAQAASTMEYELARVALYCKQCYVTCAIIMTQLLMPKLSGIRFRCFHGEKESKCAQKVLVFQGNSNSCRTHIIVNGCCCNTCNLVFTITHTSYPDSYSYRREPVMLNEAKTSMPRPKLRG